MGELKSKCDCDPLYRLLETALDEFLSSNVKSKSESHSQSSSYSPLNHDRIRLSTKTGKCCEQFSKNFLLRVLFRERCIRRYAVNMHRLTSPDVISVAFTTQFLNLLPRVWSSLVDESDDNDRGNSLGKFSDWNFDNLQPLNLDPVVQSVSLPAEKYQNMQLHLSSSVVRNIILWTLENFPRKMNREGSCRIENCRISIGASDLLESSGNTPLLQYRKFLIAKFIVRALGKCGYIVDPEQFYTLPQEESFANNVFLVSEGLYGEKLVQRIFIGRVSAKLVTPEETKVYGDCTAEVFHNLRLKGVKVVDDSSDTPSKIGKESDKDLSWLISAANLTTAKMNYDLLIKDSNSDIELVAGESKENGGILLIMYNYARVVSIINKFEEAVTKEEYPSLPAIETIDFSILYCKEELDLLRFIWEWPRILERTVDFIEQKLNISSVLKSIKELASRFNNFYATNMVLVPTNAVHNFAKMHARIYMLQACKHIFEEFLDIMQIEFNGSAIPAQQ